MTLEHELSRPWLRVTRPLSCSTRFPRNVMIAREPRCCFVDRGVESVLFDKAGEP